MKSNITSVLMYMSFKAIASTTHTMMNLKGRFTGQLNISIKW